MNNLENMKKRIIEKIEEMNCREFEKLTDALAESEINFDKSVFFTCDQCRKKYGNCCPDGDKSDVNTEVCSERFEQHCAEECC